MRSQIDIGKLGENKVTCDHDTIHAIVDDPQDETEVNLECVFPGLRGKTPVVQYPAYGILKQRVRN
jgi:hypothetical protein